MILWVWIGLGLVFLLGYCIGSSFGWKRGYEEGCKECKEADWGAG